MLPKALLAMIVADTLVLAAFTLLFVSHVMPPRQLLYALIAATVIVDGVCIVWLLRSRRRG
jgi:hypothetical protein